MSTSDDYNTVVKIIKNEFQAKFLKKLGAIWAYGEKYEYKDKFFILGMEDDIDCYFEATDKELPDEDETWLVCLVESVVERINSFC